jgi:hypothetical protein
MSFHRIGVAALVIACASGAQIMRAQACDERVAGSCQGAPILSPGTLVEAGETPSAEPAERVTRKSFRKKRSMRYRAHRHRRRHFVTPKPKPARAAEAAEADTGESTRGIETGIKDLRRAVSRNRSRENVGVSDRTLAETWANVPLKLESPLPPPAPLPKLATPSRDRQVQADANLLAPPPVRANFVATIPIKPAAAAEPASEQALRMPPAAPPGSDMTALRAIALTFAGLLAVGTAVRMVM